MSRRTSAPSAAGARWLAGRGGRVTGHAVPGAGRFVAPFALGVAVLLLVPAALTGYYAFTEYSGFSPPRPNGLGNLRRALADPFLRDSMRASLWHVGIAVPLRLAVATSLGLLLAAPRPGGRLYRLAVFLPTVIPDIALALLFLWVFNPLYGPANRILGAFGLPQPVWFSTPWGARWTVIVMLLFPIGEAFLVVLATRRQVHRSLYEAAALDGYGPVGQLRRITLPLLAPVLVLLAVRDVILTFQVNFIPAYLMTDGRPGNATLYLPLYIYDQAFEFSGLGYGAFLSLVMLAVTIVLIGAQLLLVRRWGILR